MNNKRQQNSFIKNFLVLGIPFGFFMGLFFSVFQDSGIGLIGGIISGAMFGLLMSLFILYQEKKFRKNIPQEISHEEIIYDGGCTHFKGAEGVGGWLYLTNERLFFVSHKLNIQKHQVSILLKDILNVNIGKRLGFIPNIIIVETINHTSHKFTVMKRKEWVVYIRDEMKKYK